MLVSTAVKNSYQTRRKWGKKCSTRFFFFYLVEFWDGAQRMQITDSKENERACQNAGMIHAFCQFSLYMSFASIYNCRKKKRLRDYLNVSGEND